MQRLKARAHLRRGLGRDAQAPPGSGQEVVHGAQLHEARTQASEPVGPEPSHQRHMRLAFAELSFGRPRVGQVRAEQHQVAVAIAADVVAHEALALGVERERQLELGVVVPLERDAIVEPSVQQPAGGNRVGRQRFQVGLHGAPIRLSTPQ